MRCIGGYFQRKRLLSIACLVFCVSFLFAQEEISQPVSDWQQTVRDSVNTWTYRQVSDNYLKHSNTPNADLLYAQAEQVYLEIINNQPGSDTAFCAWQYLLYLQIQSQRYATAEQTLSQFQAEFADHPLFAGCLRGAADMYYYYTDRTSTARDLYQQALHKTTGDAVMNVQCGLAMTDIRLGDYAAAESAIGTVLSEYSEHPRIAAAVKEIANAYLYYAKDPYKARNLYTWILQNKPDSSEAMAAQRGLVITNLRLAEYGPAESAMETLLSNYLAHPQIAPAVNEIANAYLYDTNDPAKARALYERILTDWPDSSEAMWAVRGLALAAIDLGAKKEADEAVEDLLLNYSGHPKISFAVREVADRYFYYANEPTKACVLYERILADWPGSPEAMDAQRGLAMAKVKMDDTEAANAAADKLLSDYEGQPDLAEKTAKVLYEYCRAGKTAEAIALSEKILSGNPDSAMTLAARAGLAQAYIQQDEEDRAREQIDLIIAGYMEAPQFGYCLIGIGEQYYLRGLKAKQGGSTEQAQTDFQKSIDVLAVNLEQAPDRQDRCISYYVTGLSHWQIEQWRPASEAFLKSIETNPRFELAGGLHWMVSDCYEKLKAAGQVSDEEADPIIEWGYRTLFEQYPENSLIEFAALQLGKIYLARGMPVTACVYFNWFLDQADLNDGRILEVRRLLEGIEGCQQ